MNHLIPYLRFGHDLFLLLGLFFVDVVPVGFLLLLILIVEQDIVLDSEFCQIPFLLLKDGLSFGVCVELCFTDTWYLLGW